MGPIRARSANLHQVDVTSARKQDAFGRVRGDLLRDLL